MKRRLKPILNRLLFEAGSLPYDLLTRHPVWHEHCREMLERIPGSPPRTLLDLGCGPGVSAIQMKRASSDDLVIGLDFSAGMIRRARANVAAAGLSAKLPLVRGDALRLPFPSASVDACTGHSFLYLLPDRARALEEIRRVLRPGGSLVLLEPAPGFGARRLARFAATPSFLLTMTLWRLASGAAGRFTRESLALTLQGAGFEHVRIEPALHGLGFVASARSPAADRAGMALS